MPDIVRPMAQARRIRMCAMGGSRNTVYPHRDRGKIGVGFAADVVVFNPDTVIDRADFLNPHQYPIGILYVLVNGAVVIDRGQHTGALAGRVLSKG